MNGPSGLRTEEDPSQEREGDETSSLSPFSVLNAVLRHRWLLIASVILGLAAGVALALLQIPTYEAVVRFVTSPGSTRAVAGVGGDLGPIQQRDPFDYYTSVLASADVLDEVLITKTSDGTTIRQRLRLSSDAANRQQARQALADAGAKLDASTRARTATSFPVLMIKVSWTDPQVAADLANAFFDALAKSDQEIRSSAAKERRTFIAAQIDGTAITLKTAENELRAFREHNRLLMLSDAADLGGGRSPVPPELELRRGQLQREVTVQSELYLNLKKAFDQARIAELDDASSLVAIERAAPPLIPTGGGRRKLVGFGGLIGLACGGLLVLGLELRRRADLSSPEAQEFVGHLASIRQEFTGIRTRATQALAPPSPTEQPPAKRDA